MKKFEGILSRIDKTEFIEYYRFHSNSDTAKHFDITSDRVTQLTRYFNFVKSPEEIKQTTKRTNQKKYGVDYVIQLDSSRDKIDYTAIGELTRERYNEQFEMLLKKLPSKEQLYQEYIVEDANYNDLLIKYELTGWSLDRVLEHYNLHKSKKQSAYKGISTKIDIYGQATYVYVQ